MTGYRCVIETTCNPKETTVLNKPDFSMTPREWVKQALGPTSDVTLSTPRHDHGNPWDDIFTIEFEGEKRVYEIHLEVRIWFSEPIPDFAQDRKQLKQYLETSPLE